MALRVLLLFVWLLSSGSASAIGLGELNAQPVLGDRLHVEIDILGAAKETLNDTCYRLRQPSSGDDIPWLNSAVLRVRKTPSPVLEIRSTQILHDPVMALAIYVGCGQEVVREYMLLASPPRAAPSVERDDPLPAAGEVPVVRRPPRMAGRNTAATPSGQSAPLRRKAVPELQISAAALPDRLTLSSGAEVGAPELQLSAELSSIDLRKMEVSEVQRELLRLEFRMLTALQAQALTQLEAGEKLRNLDGVLAELQKQVTPTGGNVAAQPAQMPMNPGAIPRAPESIPPSKPAASWEDVWAGFVAVLAAFVGVAGWLLWRNVQERRLRAAFQNDYLPISPIPVEEDKAPLKAEGTMSAPAAVLPSDAPSMAPIDLPLFGEETPAVAPDVPESAQSDTAANEARPAAVDAQIDANPVMELADVMLSFGRVKGAAQALQEYIDANPKEALQPWMRLLDVYRMAGMRAEFEALARNLNKNFNVEVLYWEPPPADTSHTIDFVVDDSMPMCAPTVKAASLEEMPRIMQQVSERWSDVDVGEYLHQLLRDNRGGARLGFPMGVVEEILFLIELKETIAGMAEGSGQA